MIDVREIKLSRRYPESRQEDITDAFTRGYTGAVEIGNKAIERLEAENAKLSNQLADVIESMGRVEERCAKLRRERDEWHRVAVSKQDIIDHMRDARAENAMLRERLLESREANEHLSTELRRYKSIFRMKPRAMNALFDENSKLREYVTAVANDTYATEMFDCGGCRFFGQCYNDEPKEHKGPGCQWRLWARELGIEVDGWPHTSH